MALGLCPIWSGIACVMRRLGPEVWLGRMDIDRVDDGRCRILGSRGMCSQGSKTRDSASNPSNSRDTAGMQEAGRDKSIASLLKSSRDCHDQSDVMTC